MWIVDTCWWLNRLYSGFGEFYLWVISPCEIFESSWQLWLSFSERTSSHVSWGTRLAFGLPDVTGSHREERRLAIRERSNRGPNSKRKRSTFSFVPVGRGTFRGSQKWTYHFCAHERPDAGWFLLSARPGNASDLKTMEFVIITSVVYLLRTRTFRNKCNLSV